MQHPGPRNRPETTGWSLVGTEQALQEIVLRWPLADGKFKATVGDEAALQ